MLNERGLRAILAVLGLAIFGAAALAVHQWATANPTSSLAVVGVMATLALAFAAVLTLEQNRSLVRAATDEAAASRETVDEMRREREWAYKPWLVIRRESVRESSGFHSEYFIVRNIGTGPALDIKFCAHRFSGDPSEHQWLSVEAPGIAPNGEERLYVAYKRVSQPDGSRPDRYRCIVDEWLVAEGQEVFAVRYEDWFGTHYRAPGGPGKPLPEQWRGQQGTADQPDWLRCQRSWGRHRARDRPSLGARPDAERSRLADPDGQRDPARAGSSARRRRRPWQASWRPMRWPAVGSTGAAC